MTDKIVSFFFFFFQAEDGIRDATVTGVQTCALPIWVRIADGLVVIGVLAQLLDAAMEVAQHRIQIDDLLAPDLENDPQDAVSRRMLRSDVDEHLADRKSTRLNSSHGSISY